MMASNHICPYHAYHAAYDHAHPVLRSVLCALYSESQLICWKNFGEELSGLLQSDLRHISKAERG